MVILLLHAGIDMDLFRRIFEENEGDRVDEAALGGPGLRLKSER
jgi:hypothetical protein